MAEDRETSPHDPSSEALIRLKDRALSAAAEGITIADARLPDRPLIYVNAGFEKLTGYSRDEVLGRNCRFLQGAGTEADTVTQIRTAVQDGDECTVEILNYRKDGSPFWNRLAITPVRDDAGEVTHFIGIQSDVSARRRAEDDLRRAKLDLERALAELQRDLDLASRVQQSLLPRRSPDVEGLQVAWEFIPSAHLAGDFLNIFSLDDRHVALYVLDVSGHGASAALLSVSLSRWLSAIPEESRLIDPDADSDSGYRINPPAKVASYLNGRFRPAPGIAQYFTLVYGVLDTQTRQFTYTAAGHPGPLHVTSAGEVVACPSTGVPVGMLTDVDFGQRTLDLAPGDRLYFYTDGITEALDADEEEFERRRLEETLLAARSRSLEESIEQVVAQVHRWQGAEIGRDDLSLLGIQID